MKTLKLLTVFFLVSWQANATGFSHNMLVAQKMLNGKQKSISVKDQKQRSALLLIPRSTVVKSATHPATESTDQEATLKPEEVAVSLSQHIARWVVRIMTISGEVLTETLISVFSAGAESSLPANAIFVSLTENVLSYLLVPLRALV
jgi:nitrogen fixation protein FixH